VDISAAQHIDLSIIRNNGTNNWDF